MNLIHQDCSLILQEEGLEGIYKQIEAVGRTCYKSEDKITEGSAKPFVDRMISSQHLAMLEHGTVYLAIPKTTYAPDAVGFYMNNPYSRVNDCNEFIFTDKYGDKVAAWCVTTNLRVLVENDLMQDLEFICEPTEYHERRITIKFTCNRQVSHEFVRHRVMSFAQESTRYCNYTKGKFGNELTFIIPCWLPIPETHSDDPNVWLELSARSADMGHFISQCHKVQSEYKFLVENLQWKPQQAATILPNALKTELCMTGFKNDLVHFFDLRYRGTTGAPHPQAQEVASKAHGLIMQQFGWNL